MNTKIFMLGLACLFFQTTYAAENNRAVGMSAFGVDGMSYLNLPPPGVYVMNYTSYSKAEKITDKHGNNVLPGVEMETYANTIRFSVFADTDILGADWLGFEVFPTFVNTKFSYGGIESTESGWSDLAIDPLALAWKLDNGNIGFSTTFTMPVGDYNQNNSLNIGTNHYTWFPQFFYNYINQNGWDLSLHAGYEYNWKNKKGLVTMTNPTGAAYQNGQSVYGEIALSNNFTDKFKMGVNLLGGYQLTSDKIFGNQVASDFLDNELDGNKYQRYAAGVSAQYLIGGYFPLQLSYLKDIKTKNAAEGDGLVLRVILPLEIF